MMQQCTKESEIATLKADFKNLMKTLWRIETKLDGFIEKSETKYATKHEVNANLYRIQIIENMFRKVIWLIISFVILSILGVVFSNTINI